MLANHKFIALLLTQENFAEEFKAFPQEEQDEFVDFILELMLNGMKYMKDLPQDEKIDNLLQVIALIPEEALEGIAMLISLVEE